MFNRAKFYTQYNDEFGYCSAKTEEVLNTLLSLFESKEKNIKTKSLQKFAYMLATVKHEVGDPMLPIAENMRYTSIARIRAVWPSRFPTDESARPYVNNPELLGNKVYGGRLGNGVLEGYKYRGRGIGAQTTGYVNYKKFGELLNVPLTSNPELAMDINIGAQILYFGCVDGLFTGRKLSGFITLAKTDYVGARAVVNGDGKLNGERVAKLAIKFENCLKASL